MDRLGAKEKILDTLRKYRYALLVVLAGVLLMCIPGKQETSAVPQTAESLAVPSVPDLETSLEQILSRIQGAGKVEVLLTEAQGEQTLYQSDDDYTDDGDTSSRRTDTVVITGTQREQTGLIRQKIPASYRGAVVVCQGADNVAVRLSIVEAVSSATGLGADRITVLKMQ